MVKNKKSETIETEIPQENLTSEKASVQPNDPGWTDHVLDMLTDDEKISGNPTTDGLRRIFEKALGCRIIQSTSDVVQSPSPENEKRATVVHTLAYYISDNDFACTVSGAADVYYGNCDKIYRNHPVAVAETRAEGRAFRRALKLRKVVAAEELSSNIEDHPDSNSVSKVSVNQINFIDVIAQRLNINVISLIKKLDISETNVYNISHEGAVKIIQQLTSHQQHMANIPEDLLGYDNKWK
jgi:hypothetical protein